MYVIPAIPWILTLVCLVDLRLVMAQAVGPNIMTSAELRVSIAFL
jgi:hypothetical protein